MYIQGGKQGFFRWGVWGGGGGGELVGIKKNEEIIKKKKKKSSNFLYLTNKGWREKESLKGTKKTLLPLLFSSNTSHPHKSLFFFFISVFSRRSHLDLMSS